MLDEEIISEAKKFAKHHKLRLAKEYTDPIKYLPDTKPISVFMAGSPGAGKTEFSRSLIQILEENQERRVVRIDADDLRSLMPGYNGENSHLFQGAVSLVVEKIHDLVLHQNQNFVFDSTFANYDKAVENIKRSLKHKRPVFIFYIYQKPETAWKFTQAREVTEGRNIPKSAFIEQFLGARETINNTFEEFNKRIILFFVKKNFEDSTVEEIVIISKGKKEIDDRIGESYTKDDLEKRL